MSGTEPTTGHVLPEAVVPYGTRSRAVILDGVDAWWRDLTPEQRVGLWVRYASPAT